MNPFSRPPTRQTLIWVAGSVAVLMLVTLGTAFFLPYVQKLYRDPLLKYESISIGDTKAEVKYALGVPKYVLGPTENDKKFGDYQRLFEVSGEGTNALKVGDSFENYQAWVFSKPGAGDPSVTVNFDNAGKATSISCLSIEITGSCAKVFGIGIGDSEDDVMVKLGKADYQKYNGVSKQLLFQKLNLILTLTKRRVYAIKVTTDGDFP